MKVIRADKAGYCFGVANAVSKVDEILSSSGENVYMLGELTHNKQEMNRLKDLGLRQIEDPKEAESGRIVIRTHGVSKDRIEEIESLGLEIVDATCPFVKKIHEKIESYDKIGFQTIIVGDPAHSEVIGSAGWTANREPVIIQTIEQAKSLKVYDKIMIVSQTTFIQEKFEEIVEVLKNKSRDILVFNTICSATKERQKAAVDLAKCVDAMLVVGGYHSSNTQKLKELCLAHCKNTWLIETVQDLDLENFRKLNTVGITAGASTPEWLIEEVTDLMQDLTVEETVLEENEPVVEEESVETPTEEVSEEVVEEKPAETVEETEKVETSQEEAPQEAEAPQEEAAAQEETEVTLEEAPEPVNEEVVTTEEAALSEQPTEETEEETQEESAEDFDFASVIDDYTKPIHKNSVVEGVVLEVHDDEVIVNIGQKSDALILKRDFTWKRNEELKDIVKVGDKITAIVTDLHTRENDGKFKLSKIKYDNQQIQSRLSRAYENGEVLYGKVDSVSGNGLMIDIGFTEIFMPASQYHLHFVKDLQALVGNDVRGVIIDYNPKRRRVILSQKVLLQEEKDQRIREQQEIKNRRFEELQLGQVVKGRVKTITEFGAFIDLNGIDGFVHRSDLTWDRNNDPHKVVKKGQEIEGKIILRSEDDKKIKLSVKALQEKPWDKFVKSYMENDEIEVVITNTLDFGAFAQIIPGVEGLIHISEISYDRVESVASELKPGQTVKVKIIKIDENKEKISLSIKATLPRPERVQKSLEDYDFDDYGGGRGGNRRKNNRRQNRDNNYYDNTEEFSTLGDSFGDLLNNLDFSSFNENENETEVETETEAVAAEAEGESEE